MHHQVRAAAPNIRLQADAVKECRFFLWGLVARAAEPGRWAAGMERFARLSTLVVSLGIILSAFAAHAGEPTVVPRDLHEFAISKGCTPPANFFAQRFEVAPPYIYAKSDDPSPLAAALWCQPDLSVESYTLLFRPGGGDVGLGSCSPAITDQSHIGGLELLKPSDVEPSSLIEPAAFRPLLDPSRPALSGPIGKRLLIKSEHDGVGRYFLCHEGTWFYRPFH
jgi:hypothetical protein